MKQSFKVFLITFFAALIVFSSIGVYVCNILVTAMSGSFTPPSDDPSITTGVDTPTIITAEPGSSFNMLFVGTDYQPEILTDYSERTKGEYPLYNDGNPLDPNAMTFPTRTRPVEADEIFLGCLNKEKSTFTLISFPGEMVVSSGGVDITLKQLYSENGIDYLKEKISALTGLPVDYYAVVSISGMAKIVDTLDGVDYNVPCVMLYSDPVQNLEINLMPGTRKLDGNSAMSLLRYNGYTDPNLSRAKTLVSFAEAMLNKVTKIAYYDRFPAIYSLVSENITTDFGAADLASNIDLIFKYSTFSKNASVYPGSYTEGGNYVPDIQSAISSFSQYR
jgi:LCP family protein required for cell wall assembly